MVKKIKYLIFFIPFLFTLNVNALLLGTPTTFAHFNDDSIVGPSNATSVGYWGTNNYYKSPYLMGGVSSASWVRRIDFNWNNANLCPNNDISISGSMAGLTNLFTEQSTSLVAYNNGIQLSCVTSIQAEGTRLDYSCYGKGGGNLAFYLFMNSYSPVRQYEIGIIKDMNVSCDATNLDIIGNATANTNSIINNQNQNSQNIINNQNSNTNSIINNQDTNTNTITQNQNQNSQNIINNQNSNTTTITQNQNQNSQNIINNQNSNTDTIVDNQNENTDTIVDNQNQNTQDIINRQDETFGNFCYTNLLDINSNYIKRNNNGSMTISGDTITLTNSSSTNNAYGWIIPVEPNKKVTISMEDIVPNVTFANVYYRFLETPITSIPDFSNSEPLSKTSKTTTVTTTTNYLLVYIRVPQTTFNVTGLMVTYSEQKLAYVSHGENKCINKLDEQTNAINNLNDTLNSDDTPDTEDEISDLNDSLISDTPITDLITLPISLLNSYISGFSGSCSPYNLGNLYGTNLILPCINLQQYLGSNLWTIIDGLFAIFMIYNIAMLMIQAFEGFTSLRDDYEGLYQPRHADTGYQAKHGGGN